MRGPVLRELTTRVETECVAHLLVLAAMVTSAAGCGKVPSAPRALERSAPIAQAQADIAPDVAAATRVPARHKIVQEAKDALLGIAAGEQVYFQRFAIYIDAADAAEIRSVLGVELDRVADQWLFSVRDASTEGFTAVAEGRRGTRATGITVLLRFERGQPITWSVERNRR